MGRIKSEKPKQNIMADKPASKAILIMGVPFIISMMLQALYNIVDSAFVANMQVNGEEAVNALTLSFPIQMLFIACSIGTGIGAYTLISHSLGRGDTERASKSAGNNIFLGIVIYIIFMLFGFFGTRAYIMTQTDNELIIELAVQYLQICCIFSMGNIFFGVFEKMLQGTGHPMCSTIAQITGAVMNMILDPIFIYGWLGLPAMGVKGAAIATVAGQMISAVLGLIFYLIYTKEIKKGVKYYIPDLRLIGAIYKIGAPAILMQAMSAIMTYGLNVILGGINQEMVTAYGIFYKIQQFVLFAGFGLRDAITPIVAFNYGAGNRQKTKDGIKFGVLYTVIILLIGTIILEVLAKPLAGIFHLSGITENYCISAMRIVAISFPFAAICISLQGVYQALYAGVQSLIVTLLRQLILVLPLAAIFANAMKSNPEQSGPVWCTFIIAEVVTAAAAILMQKKLNRKVVERIGENA